MKSLLKQYVFSCFKIFGTLVLLLGGGIVGLLIYISFSPLSFHSIKPSLQAKIESFYPGVSVKFETLSLKAYSLKEPFVLELTNADIQIRDESLEASVKARQIIVGFRLRSSWNNVVSVNTLIIQQPQVNISSLPLLKETPPNSLLPFFLDSLKSLEQMTKAFPKHIEIIEGSFLFPQEFPNQVFKGSGSLKRKKEAWIVYAQYQGDQSVIHIDAHYNYLHQIFKTRFAFDHLNFNTLKGISPRMGLDVLQGIDLPLVGEGQLIYNVKLGEVQDGSIQVSSKKSGEMMHEHLGSRPLPIETFVFEGKYKERIFFVEKLLLETLGTKAQAEGELLYDPREKSIKIDLLGTANGVKFDHLKFLWPQNLAKVPRDWVTNNISHGYSPHAQMVFHGSLKLENNIVFNIEKILGKIDIHQAHVRYMEKMPIVENVSGQAFFDDKAFKIIVTEGDSKKQKIKNSTIIITELDQKDQNIAINLDVDGYIQEALELLNCPPLRYADSLTLNPKKTKGRHETSVLLKFPLERSVSLKDVQVTSISTMSNMALETPISFLPYSLKNGNFRLSVNEDFMTVYGTGEIAEKPASILWRRSLNDRLQRTNTIEVKTTFQSHFLKDFKIDTDFIRGFAPLKFVYHQSPSKESLSFYMDLKPLYINLKLFEKREHYQGALRGKCILKKGYLKEIEKIDFDIPQVFHLKGNGQFQKAQPSYSLKNFNIETLKIGSSFFKGHLKGLESGAYHFTLTGPKLDISNLFDQTSSQDISVHIPLTIDFHIEDLIFRSNKRFFHVKGQGEWNNDHFKTLNVSANLTPHSLQPDIVMKITPVSAQGRILDIAAKNAGFLIKTMGWSEKVKNGTVQLKAEQRGGIQAPWKGKLKVKDFSLMQAPGLGKLLTLAFPTGLIELFSEEGLKFRIFKTMFSYEPGKIVLTQGKAVGSSLGLSVYGVIWPKNEQIHLQGNLIPAYFLNTILNRIPILGELLSGGKNEGIFAISYKVKGTFDNPVISSNPLSALTPGLIRNLFSEDIPSHGEENSKEEEKEDSSEE